MYTVQLHQFKDGDWGFRFLAKNKQIIARSSEGYTRKDNALRALTYFMENMNMLMESDVKWKDTVETIPYDIPVLED